MCCTYAGNEKLKVYEYCYFALGLVRVLLAILMPSCLHHLLLAHWCIDTIVFLTVVYMCLVKLALALVRYKSSLIV